MKDNLLLGTNNTGKLQEFYFYINHFKLFNDYQIIDLKEFKDIGEPIEYGRTFQENSEIKAKYFFKKTDTLVLCDDSGFIVDHLKNYPGIKTAREAREKGGEQKVVEFIFSKFKNSNYIAASFFCSICLLGGNRKYSVSGKIPGYIVEEKKGVNGFGYDPYFVPENSDKTFAEMEKDQKLLNSHRYKAFEKLSIQMLLGN